MRIPRANKVSYKTSGKYFPPFLESTVKYTPNDVLPVLEDLCTGEAPQNAPPK